MSDVEKVLVDLSFKFEDMYDFLDKCTEAWGRKIASIPIQSEHFKWLINMNTVATILKAKLQMFEGDLKKS